MVTLAGHGLTLHRSFPVKKTCKDVTYLKSYFQFVRLFGNKVSLTQDSCRRRKIQRPEEYKQNFNVSSGKSFVCPSRKSFVCPSSSCKSFVCPSSLLTSRQRAFAQNVEVLLVFSGRCISFNPQLSCYRQILSQKKSNDGEH